MRRLPVDNWGIPTGDSEDWNGGHRAARDGRVFDDGFDKVPDGAVFALSGGDRRSRSSSRRAIPAAQMFAPRNDDVVGIEPMAAPTDALRRGNYRFAVAGKPETTRFSIKVD